MALAPEHRFQSVEDFLISVLNVITELTGHASADVRPAWQSPAQAPATVAYSPPSGSTPPVPSGKPAGATGNRRPGLIIGSSVAALIAVAVVFFVMLHRTR